MSSHALGRQALPWLLALAMGVVVSPSAMAAITCVSNSAELQAALTEAGSNGEHDQIQVVTSDPYVGSSGSSAFVYNTGENFDLTIAGGYTPGPADTCIPPPAQSGGTPATLDGGGLRRALLINGGTGTGDIVIRDIRFRNGDTAGGGGGAIIGQDGFRGDVQLLRVHFEDNEAESSGGGLRITTTGEVEVSGGTFVGNASDTDAGAAYIDVAQTTSALRVRFNQNTLFANGCLPGAPATCDVGGVIVAQDAVTAIYNNVFFGNDGVDFENRGANTTLAHNNIGGVTGDALLMNYGNIDLADVGFIDMGANPPNLRLLESSPLIDRGTAGLPLATGYTIYGSTPDIGYHEHFGIRFRDGFESP